MFYVLKLISSQMPELLSHDNLRVYGPAFDTLTDQWTLLIIVVCALLLSAFVAIAIYGSYELTVEVSRIIYEEE